MKFISTETFSIDDDVIRKNDIVIYNEDTRELYNVTTKIDYKDVNPKIKQYLVKIEPSESTITFSSIVEQMKEIYSRKNSDYGNSFEQSLDEEGLAAARIRLGDKWNRFKTLSKGKEIKVTNESLQDTLIDMANYCIMTSMWLSKK